MKTTSIYLSLGILLGIALSMMVYLLIQTKPEKQDFVHPNQKTQIIPGEDYHQRLIIDQKPDDNNSGIINPSVTITYKTNGYQNRSKDSLISNTQKADTPNLRSRFSIDTTGWFTNGSYWTSQISIDTTAWFTKGNYHLSPTKLDNFSYINIALNLKSYQNVPSVDLDSNKHFLTIVTDTNSSHYSKGFLAKYGNSPKLLYNKITKDSIQFDVMQPNGIITTNIFKTNILGYNYETNDGKFMKFSKLPEAPVEKGNTPSLKKSMHSESNLYFIYDPLQKVGRVRIDYSLMYNRTGLYFANQLQSMMPVYQAEVGLRYKLK